MLPAILLLLAAAVLILPRLLVPAFRGPRFKPCPSSPNCATASVTVSAALPADAAALQARARLAVLALGRTRIAEDEPGYLRAECRSLLFGFVDDLELRFAPDRIEIRSASRVGHSDLGVNRRRIERLRAELEASAGR